MITEADEAPNPPSAGRGTRKAGVWSIWVRKSEKQGGCCYKSWSLKAWEPGAPMSMGRKKWVSQFERSQRIQPTFAFLPHSHSRWIERCLLQHWWGCIFTQYSKPHVSLYQKHLTDLPRNVLAIILNAYKSCASGASEIFEFLSMSPFFSWKHSMVNPPYFAGEIFSSRILAAVEKVYDLLDSAMSSFCDTYFVMPPLWFQSKSQE